MMLVYITIYHYMWREMLFWSTWGYMNDLDLCEEIKLEMRKIGFPQDLYDSIVNSLEFIEATGKEPHLQRTILSLMFYRKIIYSSQMVQPSIRMALTIATETRQWLDDIKLVILPALYKIHEIESGQHV